MPLPERLISPSFSNYRISATRSTARSFAQTAPQRCSQLKVLAARDKTFDMSVWWLLIKNAHSSSLLVKHLQIFAHAIIAGMFRICSEQQEHAQRARSAFKIALRDFS
jgi:hypothetical protein